jgi:glycerate kinase
MIILAPDSFKGTMTSPEAARGMAEGIRRVRPDVQIHASPMADGGEGTLDILLDITGGERCYETVAATDFQPRKISYGIISSQDGSRTAIIETARIVGLHGSRHVPVELRSSFGVGELVRVCLDQGIRHFFITLGGSGTNDGGAGVLAALGVKLLDKQGRQVTPVPAGLPDLRGVDFSGLDPRLNDSRIELLCDVTNPLCGPRGATAVYGPQKGVTPDRIAYFDLCLKRLASLCDRQMGDEVSRREGAGAAGGIAYAFQLLGAKHRSGAEIMCTLSGLDDLLKKATFLITGEGRSDAQTLHGKTPFVLAQHARRHGVPAALLSGIIEQSSRTELAKWFDVLIETKPATMSYAESKSRAYQLLVNAASRFAREYLGK